MTAKAVADAVLWHKSRWPESSGQRLYDYGVGFSDGFARAVDELTRSGVIAVNEDESALPPQVEALEPVVPIVAVVAIVPLPPVAMSSPDARWLSRNGEVLIPVPLPGAIVPRA
jgi:hypothetical protein